MQSRPIMYAKAYLLLRSKFHLAEQPSCATELIDDEQGIADVERNVPAAIRVKVKITHCPFPDTIKIRPNQFPLRI